MAHTFANLLTHAIFSTKERAASITPEIRSDLHAYLGGITRELRAQAIAIGGTADHVHLLLQLPAELANRRMLADREGEFIPLAA